MVPVLEFEGITKEYRSVFPGRTVRALENFSLTVEQGEIFGFLGPNGAGKSTAIHLAMGFMRPTAGKGRMLGQPFGNTNARRRVGFLAENVALYHRPAEQLIRFYGALNGMQGRSLRRRAAEVLALVGLSAEARGNVGRFSRGMVQRIGLAQAIVNSPEFLILDEPTSALDPVSRVAVRDLLRSAREAGKTIFLSSHLLSEVELISDRVAMLHRGKLARLGKTSDLLQSGTETEIVARGVSPGPFRGTLNGNRLVKFTVPIAEQRAALERVWAQGGEVVSVNPVRRSLEDVFLEVTRDLGPSASEGRTG
ncbi:MAG TPA: ABC transporter ATP-binding protein [Terriglobales bacterium]|nr:ABC transporter ATP-binding protein [Terriglobales bacterium]